MSKKPSTPKAKSKAIGGTEECTVTRQMVLTNYSRLCKSIGVPINTHINEILRGTGDEEGELINFMLEGEIGSLGPGGVRAIVMAFLGTGPGIMSGPYAHLKYVRIWNQDIGNEGAFAISMLLQSIPPSLNIAYLELLECGVGVDGCKAISNVLRSQKLPGLLTLKLDYNSEIGDDGVEALCEGLFTNTVLKKLHLDYCGIGARGSIKLAQLVAMPSCALATLSLQGNTLGDEGLYHLSLGLARSRHLEKLNLSDNAIRHDMKALTAFRDALIRSKALAHIDFTYNHIELDGAQVILPALGPDNAKLLSFQVDSTLPTAIFSKLNRAPVSEKKKGGKKKGGKKKKK